MIDNTKIREIAGAKGVLDIVVEKDYILDWLLWGISQNEYLSERIIFKGGTALHKMYFPDWRFSEDLDFTTTVIIDKDTLTDAVIELCNVVKSESGIELALKEISAEGIGDEEWTFEAKIKYIGPRKQSGGDLPTVVLHITNDELLMDRPIKKTIILLYDDVPSDFSILTYSLEEILAEKIRSVLHQRCWARDIYDAWRLFNEIKNLVDIEKVMDIYVRKTQYRGKTPGIPANITERIQRLKSQWKEGLKRQMKEPPDFDKVQNELLLQIKKLFEEYNLIKKGGLKMIESHYVMRYKKGDFEVEVQGDKAFVESKFKELLELKIDTIEPKSATAIKERPFGDGEKKMSLVEFIKAKKPKGHDETILLFGYYIEKFENQASFNTEDIRKCYQQAKIPPTKNVATYTRLLTKDGYIMAAAEKKNNLKAWVLTNTGIEKVENLADNH